MKDYLTYENERNRRSHKLFGDIVAEVFGTNNILVAHHINLTLSDGLETLEEIPAADTLVFDHDILKKLFGPAYLSVAQQLAVVPAEQRDELLASLYYGRAVRQRA